jgi:tetratricopeptide (TPR) repeat protein
MSFLKKLFSSDPKALRDKGDSLFAASEFGAAKLTYEKAIDASSDELRPALQDKIRACMDGIARQRIDEAKQYLESGDVELATQELEGALEVAIDSTVRREAQSLLDGLEGRAAQAQAVSEDMSEEERIAVLMGQWEEAQAEEYERYGDAIVDALLELHDERFEEARARLESLLESASTPRYLWLEVGRARLLTDDARGGEEAFEHFVENLEEGESSETALAVHLTLARLADDDGRFDQAMKRFEAAVETLPDDYRPYLAMGAFLRSKGHGEEALAVLLTALDLSKSHAVDWRLLEELGLASDDAGKPNEARKFLEQVIEFFTGRQVMDFPPSTAIALAELYESEGRLDRAADLYRALSQGSDRDRHAEYHYEAGRLLHQLELDDEARRMLTRAAALAGEQDSELREKIAALLQPDA